MEDAGAMTQKYSLNVNGKASHGRSRSTDMPLLYALRDDLGLNNPHFGCGLAQCGACTVHLDGQPTRSCIDAGLGRSATARSSRSPASARRTSRIRCKRLMSRKQVPQCAYCINGWIMTAAAFLRDNKKPTDDRNPHALTGLKCRCGTHMAILRAVKRAAAMMG